jgi:hypothetical protein
LALSLPPYADLTNRRLISKIDGQPGVLVDELFLRDLMQETLSRIHVDADWYLQANPDVRAAVENGSIASAEEHYRRYGYFDHRMPYRIVVDEAWYAAGYPDVQEAKEIGTFLTGQEHFEKFGFREGRIPFAGFSFRSMSA